MYSHIWKKIWTRESKFSSVICNQNSYSSSRLILLPLSLRLRLSTISKISKANSFESFISIKKKKKNENQMLEYIILFSRL